jgi:uncharacterized protein
MIADSIISEVVRRLVNVYHPLKVYLFGSYAWGEPREESDLDLLVIVDQSDQKIHHRSVLGERALMGLMIDRDILVYTQKEFDERAKSKTSMFHQIKMQGKCLYARS